MAIKTEHAGAKNGGGYWGRRAFAKEHCNALRRAADKTEIDDAVSAWHDGDSPLELHEYLGWTWEEYAHWVKHNEPPDRPLPMPPAHTAPRRKKDTKRWCLGRVGRAHEGVCQNYYDAKGWSFQTPPPEWKVLVCKRCGRELDSWHGRWAQKTRPEWVR